MSCRVVDADSIHTFRVFDAPHSRASLSANGAIKRGLAIAICALSMAVALGVWNFTVTQWRLARNPPPGHYYNVYGRQMYIYCVGAGSPAIVIESGLSSDSLGWYGVQHSLAKLTRVCAYDRSGLGLSEPRPGPRDAEAIASQLHDLLNQAAIERPFIALGWSAGALYMREYARQFPSDIAGVALVEPSLPRQLEAIPGARAAYEADRQTLPAQYRWERVRVWTGWERLMGRCWNSPADDVVKVLTAEDAARLANLYVAKTCRPAYIGGEMGEFMDFDTTSGHAVRLSSFGQVPLLIMTKDTERRPASMTADDRAEAEAWSREQEALKKLSARSWRVVARNSGHAIHHDRPELLVAEVARLANFLRGGPVPPFGSTLTE